MSMSSPFSVDYFAARRRFLEEAGRAGAELESYCTTEAGPSGESLSIEVARLGEPNAARVVVVSSGLHGVEGFFGSAVQLELLRHLSDPAVVPEGTGVVFLHGLNPYGFAHLRRFDENNVDLNRNFVLEEKGYRGCPPRYAELNTLLNPQRPPDGWDAFRIRSLGAILRYGFMDLKQAVAGGQFEFPKGLFFGGSRPSHLRSFLSTRLPEWTGLAEQILHVDFHTGLGRWAGYELLLDSCVGPARHARLATWFGEDRVRGPDPSGIAYDVSGGLGEWCESQFSDRSYTLLCAEFGTYGPLTVLKALRAENQAHHWGDPRSPTTRWAKQSLKEVFTPASTEWRRACVTQGVGIVKRALHVRLEHPASAQPEIGR
jgi:hypothetical protein